MPINCYICTMKEKKYVSFQIMAKRLRDAELIQFIEETSAKEELTTSEFCRKLLKEAMERYNKPQMGTIDA